MTSQYADVELPTIEELDAARTISGPFSHIGGSCIAEYVEPPAPLNASVLIRATYTNPKVTPINLIGKAHPQAPPLHLHFNQWESFIVARGKVCTSETYEVKEKTHAKGDVYHIAPWLPHGFHPCADVNEDSTIYLWTHPRTAPDPLDRLYFQTLIGWLDDVYEKKEPNSLLQLMTMQHATATAMVVFPKAWWLGPLRWWIPWHVQGILAMIGGWCGYRPLLERHMTPEEWADYLHAKKN